MNLNDDDAANQEYIAGTEYGWYKSSNAIILKLCKWQEDINLFAI